MKRLEKFLRTYDAKKISNLLLIVVILAMIVSEIFDFTGIIWYVIIYTVLDVSVTLMVLNEKKYYIKKRVNICFILLSSHVWLYVNSYIFARLLFPKVSPTIFMLVLFFVCVFVSKKIDERIKQM